MIEARDIVIERMTKGEAIDAKNIIHTGSDGYRFSDRRLKIDKLSDPLDDAYTLGESSEKTKEAE
jgi:hypothetical protein